MTPRHIIVLAGNDDDTPDSHLRAMEFYEREERRLAAAKRLNYTAWFLLIGAVVAIVWEAVK